MNRVTINNDCRNGHKTKQPSRRAGPRHKLKLVVQSLVAATALTWLGLPRQAAAQTPCPSGGQQLIIYHAGSLSAAFTPLEQLFTSETGVCVTDVSAGSVDAARRITAGNQPCDIFASADYLDIDDLLKPAGYADYDLLFGQGSMVLSYTTASKGAAGITKSGQEFAPPAPIPQVADDWYKQLTQAGVWIGGSHPFLDPSGYRADLIFQLAETVYNVPNLYDTLLQHYSVIKTNDTLGQTYDYSFTYEHSALAAYKANPSTYRYARLPPLIGLSRSRLNPHYASAAITVPGLRTPGSVPTVELNASRVIWGLTILKSAPNADNAVRFLELLFSDRGVAVQTSVGPKPISPPQVSAADAGAVPSSLKSLVSVLQ